MSIRRGWPPSNGCCSKPRDRPLWSLLRRTPSTTLGSKPYLLENFATRTIASNGREPSSRIGRKESLSGTGIPHVSCLWAKRIPKLARLRRWGFSPGENHNSRALAGGHDRRLGERQVNLCAPPFQGDRDSVVRLLPRSCVG